MQLLGLLLPIDVVSNKVGLFPKIMVRLYISMYL